MLRRRPPQPAFAQGAFAGEVEPRELVGLIHLRQIRGDRGIARRHRPRHGGDLARTAQRLGPVLGVPQRLCALLQQAVQASAKAVLRARVGGIEPQQREIERDRILGPVEQASLGQGFRGALVRFGGALRRQRNRGRTPVQFIDGAVVAADGDAGHADRIGTVVRAVRVRGIARTTGEPRQRQQQGGEDRAQTPSVMGASGPHERMPADMTGRRYRLNRDLRLLSPD